MNFLGIIYTYIHKRTHKNCLSIIWYSWKIYGPSCQIPPFPSPKNSKAIEIFFPTPPKLPLLVICPKYLYVSVIASPHPNLSVSDIIGLIWLHDGNESTIHIYVYTYPFLSYINLVGSFLFLFSYIWVYFLSPSLSSHY